MLSCVYNLVLLLLLMNVFSSFITIISVKTPIKRYDCIYLRLSFHCLFLRTHITETETVTKVEDVLIITHRNNSSATGDNRKYLLICSQHFYLFISTERINIHTVCVLTKPSNHPHSVCVI